MTNPLVTIVVVPRERFSVTMLSLDSIYRNADEPFRLVYVDAGSPPYVRRYLEEQSRQRDFELIRIEELLPPNRARNIGFAGVATKYVVFVDNDLVVAKGWLSALVRCAEETGASNVGPLYLIGDPRKQVIHMAGGSLEVTYRGGQPVFKERHRFVYERVADVRDRLRRERCDLVEFHCMLVRSDHLRQVGGLDEQLLGTREHVDLAVALRDIGGTVYFEPASEVSYINDGGYVLSDLPFYHLRWSPGWRGPSLDHFARKWGLAPDDTMLNEYEAWADRHSRRLDLPNPLRARKAAAGSNRASRARTGSELLDQMESLDFPPADLAAVGNALEVIRQGSGMLGARLQPLTAHLVGTASTLASHGAAATHILAGLFHSAYDGHDAILRLDALPAEERRDLAAIIGEEAERVVAHYAVAQAQLEASVPPLATLDQMPLDLAKAMLIVMASTVSMLGDDAGALAAISPDWWQDRLGLFRTVADRLEAAAMAEALAAALGGVASPLAAPGWQGQRAG